MIPMDEIGNILYEARIAQGMTLDAAQDKLKIQTKFLTAMEEGRFDMLPTPVHARGYLRNYAKYLDLDPQPLVENYQMQVAASGGRRRRRAPEAQAAAAGTLPTSADNVFFDPVNMQMNPMRSSGNGESILRIIIILALIAAIVLVASRFFVGGNPDSSVGEIVQQFWSNVILGETPATAADINVDEVIESAEIAPENPLIVETARGEADIVDAATAVPLFNCPLNAEVMTLRIDATERVWMQLYIDGELQIQDNVKGGQSVEFIADDSFRVNTGNAYAIYVTVNGTPLGRLGQPQEVVDVTCNTVAG